MKNLNTISTITKRTLLFNLVLMLILLLSQSSFGQLKFTVNGNIKDARNGEELIGASILVKELGTGNISNAYGFYSLTLPQGKYTLSFSYLGYATQDISIELNENKKQDIQLKEESRQIEEIVIQGEKEEVDRNVRSTETGVTKLEIKTIQKMPALLGEVDIIRSIQLTPGVSSVGEGTSGFNVRGGGVDQNLILLDESPIFNSSHSLGLFSVFNPDAVKDVKLVKGGIPAQYGGRLSSLLDIRMKEGNSKQLGGSGGLGTIFSRFTLEAPIVQDKSSFIISARRSYADIFLKLSPDEDLRKNKLYFYDLSTKINYKFNNRDRVFLSGYFGRDVFTFGDEFQTNWGNGTGTIRWNHLFSEKLFANFTGIYSNYAYSLGIPEGTQAFDWDSRIINWNVKADFTYYMNPQNSLNFGGSAIWYRIKPGQARPLNGESIFNNIVLDNQNAGEYALFLDHEFAPSQNLSFQYGLRYSYYSLYGAGTYYDFEGETGSRKTAVNPQFYEKGETITSYYNLEPRFSARISLNPSTSLKLSYNRMAQYLHLISNTTAASPTDVWSPSTRNIKPELADQIAFGYFKNFKDNTVEASVEVYYKEMSNQIDYVDGAELLLNDQLEGELLYGLGRSYGLEFYVKKNSGKLNGWVSYTLSKTERKIQGINNFEWYNAKYDRTHNLAIVGLYELDKRWSFSANFTYATGVATTFPNSRYEIGGITVPHNTGEVRNNYRVPAYHRLDVSATLEGKKKPGRKYEHSWVFSIYNVYARRNAFTVYFRQNEDNPRITEAVRLSVFGTILPAVTFNFKF